MDTDFMVFFVFIILILYVLAEMISDGWTYLIFALFFAAIFANTQSASPIFFSNDAYLGFGRLFNVFWLMLTVLCIIKSINAGRELGIFKSIGGKK